MRLRAFEVAWARTIGRTLLPPGLLGGAVDHVDLGREVENECAQSPWYAALVVRAALWLTWFAPLFLLRRLRTFGGLDAHRRQEVLECLLASPRNAVRATATLLKLTFCVRLLGDERVFAEIGAYEHGRPAAARSAR